MSSDPPLLVGVDVGTTRIKAGIVDLRGRELRCAAVATRWRQRPSGGEAAPDDFVEAVRGALTALLAAAPPGEIVGVGVTSIGETTILLGPDGSAVGPAVAWYDTRAADDLAELTAAVSEMEFSRRTGLVGEAIPTVATLRWLMRNHPELRRATRTLAVAEWVAHSLGGAIASELSLASRTGALAIADRHWWPEVLRWAHVAPGLFGELRPAGSSWGRVHDGGAGLERLEGAVLTVAGHDHLVASVGSGVTRADQVMDSCGTAEALLRAVAADDARDPGAGVAQGISTGWHVLAEHHSLMVGLRLGIVLSPVLERQGSSASDGRTPLDDPALQWLDGAGPGAEPPAAVRAWLQATRSVVARAVSAVDELAELGGPVAEVRVGGGWAANPVLRRLKADVFPHPVYPDVAEPGVRGAALFAGQAAGVFRSADEFPAPALLQAAADAGGDPTGDVDAVPNPL